MKKILALIAYILIIPSLNIGAQSFPSSYAGQVLGQKINPELAESHQAFLMLGQSGSTQKISFFNADYLGVVWRLGLITAPQGIVSEIIFQNTYNTKEQAEKVYESLSLKCLELYGQYHESTHKMTARRAADTFFMQDKNAFTLRMREIKQKKGKEYTVEVQLLYIDPNNALLWAPDAK